VPGALDERLELPMRGGGNLVLFRLGQTELRQRAAEALEVTDRPQALDVVDRQFEQRDLAAGVGERWSRQRRIRGCLALGLMHLHGVGRDR
jgi:hypothetical protein